MGAAQIAGKKHVKKTVGAKLKKSAACCSMFVLQTYHARCRLGTCPLIKLCCVTAAVFGSTVALESTRRQPAGSTRLVLVLLDALVVR